jgi:hypothetical protein
MFELPPGFAARYRPATDQEVLERSFGLLKAPKNPNATGWEQQRGTLEDQAIFGPVRDYECACGKYRGQKHENMICDRCGVKLTTRAARRWRFGHIDLRQPIIHPFGKSAEQLGAIPVLPADFVESGRGEKLAVLYDELVRSLACESSDGVVKSFNRLLELLVPLVTLAHEWDLQEGELLCFGMALVPRLNTVNDTCGSCGYPLEGLEVLVCPGCGKKFQ